MTVKISHGKLQKLHEMVDPSRLDAELREGAAKFDVIPDVHPEDFIFQFILTHPSFCSEARAAGHYFESGHESAVRFDELVTKFYSQERRPIDVLEFAAGYGCVTRHLKKMTKYNIYSCDIHPQAVEFLQDLIGVQAILSNKVPDQLTTGRKFDVVFALSFFSHMPDAVWKRWLRKLLDLVADDGLLIFTTHGSKSIALLGVPPADKNGYWFEPASEQRDLATDEYGTTVTTARYVIDKVRSFEDAELVYFEEGVWWKHQDVCMLRKLSSTGGSPQVPASDNALLPPLELLSDGTVSIEEYIRNGEGFVNYFLINHAQLRPHEAVLDIGSGIGQKSRPLSRYLTNRYEGLDVMAEAVEWCKTAYAGFPKFHFQVADLHSVHYNPKGKLRAEEYTLPYEDESFDLVLLSSVFTHMLPEGVARYISEISRVLKPRGRCVASYFLLNPEAQSNIEKKINVFSAPHKWSEACYVADLQVPETIVFHDESRIRELHARHGLSIIEMSFGFWSGKADLTKSILDIIIALKPPR